MLNIAKYRETYSKAQWLNAKCRMQIAKCKIEQIYQNCY